MSFSYHSSFYCTYAICSQQPSTGCNIPELYYIYVHCYCNSLVVGPPEVIMKSKQLVQSQYKKHFKRSGAFARGVNCKPRSVNCKTDFQQVLLSVPTSQTISTQFYEQSYIKFRISNGSIYTDLERTIYKYFSEILKKIALCVYGEYAKRSKKYIAIKHISFNIKRH